jgi:CheY-like chemotaxis protein
VGLPGIDGFEVLRRLKSDERFRRIPVFVTSVVDERAAGLALGATDFLVKPIDRDALLGHLARHLLPEGTSRTALVIDADSSTVDALRTQLQRSGFEVVSCASAADGLRVARSRPVDLIICGLPLPDRDGLTALAALDADPATCAVPVLAWTTINGADWGTGRPILGVLARGGEVDRQLTDFLQSRALAHSDVAAGATTLLEQT